MYWRQGFKNVHNNSIWLASTHYPPPPPPGQSYAFVQATAGVGTVLIWDVI